MILLEFSMSPMDKGESVSDQVSRSLKIIDESGVPYKLNPMGTVLEGEFDEVMGVVKQCYETMRSDSKRITCGIKIDYREGKSGRLESKMASIENKSYNGFLYGSFMKCGDKIYIIEFNCRFGDPECILALHLLKTNFYKFMIDLLRNNANYKLEFSKNKLLTFLI